MTDFIEMCGKHSNITRSQVSGKIFFNFSNAEFKMMPDSNLVEWEWYEDDYDDEDDYDYGVCKLCDITVLSSNDESMMLLVGECEMEVLFSKF